MILLTLLYFELKKKTVDGNIILLLESNLYLYIYIQLEQFVFIFLNSTTIIIGICLICDLPVLEIVTRQIPKSQYYEKLIYE